MTGNGGDRSQLFRVTLKPYIVHGAPPHACMLGPRELPASGQGRIGTRSVGQLVGAAWDGPQPLRKDADATRIARITHQGGS